MFTIDDSVKNTFAGTKMGILIVKNIEPLCKADDAVQSGILEEIQKRYGNLERKELKALYPIQAYTAYYKKFGNSYPVLAQLESVLKGKKSLHTESALLQAMFLTELESMLLTAGHDLSKLQLPLQLKTADGSEVYQSISGREVTAVSSDLMVCDQTNVISSIMRGPDYASRITDTTSDVLFTIYAPPGIESDYIKTTLQKLQSRIQAFSHACQTETLEVFSKG